MSSIFRRSKKKIVLIGLLLLMMGVAWYFREHLTFEEIKRNREALLRFVEAHYPLSVALLLGVELLVAFFLPGAIVLTLAGGFLFGVVWGTVYVMTGTALGESLAFLFARYVAGNWIHSRYRDHLKRFNREIARHGSSYLLMLRIVPVLPSFAVNYLAGMTRMSLKRFILTTVAGELPGCIVFTYAGKQLGNITSVDDIMTPKLLAAFLVLALFALLPIAFRFLRGRFPSGDRA